MKDKSASNKKLFTYSLSLLAMLFGLLLLVILGGKFYSAYRDFKTGNVEVVQGYVDDFHPMSPRGGEYETFRIHNVKFHYSDFESNPGFNQTSSHGGPIRQGLPVRITYINDLDGGLEGNIIVKLEIAASGETTGPNLEK
jgi:hypothetical protein